MLNLRHLRTTALLVPVASAAALADDPGNQSQFPRVITGQVTDADGNPLAGALVEWGYFRDDPEDRESVETNVDGQYRLDTSNVGRDFRIGVSHAGFAPRHLDGIIPGPADDPSSIDFQLSTGAEFTLRITDRSGNPVSDLDVTPRTPSNGFRSSFSFPVQPTLLPGRGRIARTDDDGRVMLSDLPPRPSAPRGRTLPDGTPFAWNWLSIRLHLGDEWVHEFQITEAEVIESDSIEVQIPESRVPGFDERQDGTIRGRVVDKQTGEPLTDYLVTLRHRPEPLVIRSDDGRFTYDTMLQNGREYQTRIFAPGYGVAVVRIPAESPDRSVEQTFELERHPSLEGRLVDATTGDPLSDVQIVAGVAKDSGFNYVEWVSLDRYADGNHGLENVIRVTTKEDGRFTVPEEPGRPATLVILTPGYGRLILPHWKRPDLDDDGLLHVPLPPAASATAVALRETQLGAQANAATISFQSDDGFEHMYHSTALDDDGRLRLESLAPGAYRFVLYLNSRSFSFPCYSKTFTLAPGEHRDVLLGDMPGTLRIYGTADPFAMVRVRPTFPAEISNFAVPADVDGRFELRDLFPGEYVVSVDNSRASSAIRIDGPSQTIQLENDMELMLATPRPPAARASQPD